MRTNYSLSCGVAVSNVAISMFHKFMEIKKKVALVHGTHYLLMPAEPGKCLFRGHGGFQPLNYIILACKIDPCGSACVDHQLSVYKNHQMPVISYQLRYV